MTEADRAVLGERTKISSSGISAFISAMWRGSASAPRTADRTISVKETRSAGSDFSEERTERSLRSDSMSRRRSVSLRCMAADASGASPGLCSMAAEIMAEERSFLARGTNFPAAAEKSERTSVSGSDIICPRLHPGPLSRISSFSRRASFSSFRGAPPPSRPCRLRGPGPAGSC